MNQNEMKCVFFLGCDDCSATLQTVKADSVAKFLGSMLSAEKVKGGV